MTNLKYGMVVSVELNYSEVVGTVTEISGNSDKFYIVDENGTEYKFYSDIHKVTILDKAVFHGMENMEVVNPLDHQFYEYAYKVSVYNYDSMMYGVFADCEQTALDMVVDYLESKGQTGLFYDLDEVEEMEKDGYADMFLVAGNHCHHLDSSHIHIEEVK